MSIHTKVFATLLKLLRLLLPVPTMETNKSMHATTTRMRIDTRTTLQNPSLSTIVNMKMDADMGMITAIVTDMGNDNTTVTMKILTVNMRVIIMPKLLSLPTIMDTDVDTPTEKGMVTDMEIAVAAKVPNLIQKKKLRKQNERPCVGWSLRLFFASFFWVCCQECSHSMLHCMANHSK